jgi:uncharacterized protein YraI
MKNSLTTTSIVLIFILTACSFPSAKPVNPSVPAATNIQLSTSIPTDTILPTLALRTETFTSVSPTAVPTSTPTVIPFVESLDATVTADLLSCRYGPGPEYLYLYGLKKGANIQLMGRTDGNNWVMVKGKNLCWVNAKYIEIKGDLQTLKVVYPDGYKLPVSPYYSATTVLSAVRDANNISKVTVKWVDITLRPGDEEDENMFIYIIEVWRCESGKMIFDPLASNDPVVTFVDEAGCNVPSHGRVFFQEKHGFAGPSEIPWPAR